MFLIIENYEEVFESNSHQHAQICQVHFGLSLLNLFQYSIAPRKHHRLQFLSVIESVHSPSYPICLLWFIQLWLYRKKKKLQILYIFKEIMAFYSRSNFFAHLTLLLFSCLFSVLILLLIFVCLLFMMSNERNNFLHSEL